MARLAKPPLQIPFKQDGQLVDYYHPSFASRTTFPITLKDNFEFDETLEFDSFSWAHTGSRFRFKGLETGFMYEMFPVEAEKAVPFMEKGILKGRFTFVKKNHYFGIKLVE